MPGRLAAFDATTLKQLWSDDDNVLFAKSVPPTIADGKVIRATAADQVVVYGLLRRPGSHFPVPHRPPRACVSIAQKHASFGGASGLLGGATRDETPLDDRVRGHFRDYRREIFGMPETSLTSSLSCFSAPSALY